MKIIESRKKNIKKSNIFLPPLLAADREYIRGIFQALCNIIEPTIIEGPAPTTNNNFKLTPREMWTNIKHFFDLAIEHGQPLTITGMALFCDMDREYLTQLADSGEASGCKYPIEYAFLKKCRKFVENYNEYAAHKKLNPAGPIFILKNFGWKDRFEIEAHSTQGALTEQEREIAQKRIRQFSEIKPS